MNAMTSEKSCQDGGVLSCCRTKMPSLMKVEQLPVASGSQAFRVMR